MPHKILNDIRKSHTLARSVALIAVTAAMTLPSQAADYTLTASGTSAHIDADSGAGMNNWQVGGANHLQKQWFYVRVGNGNYFFALWCF